MVLLFTASNSLAQLGPLVLTRGCPTMVLPHWLVLSSSPSIGEYPEFVFDTHYTDCYNCYAEKENEVVTCEHYLNEGIQCPLCVNVTRLTDVYNPRTGNYEVIYKIIEVKNGEEKVWYTYYIYKVPIYGTDNNGNKWIIGYKYYWNLIPDVVGVLIDYNNGNKTLQY